MKNEDFYASGGRCKRVFYAPARSGTQTMRYTGEYQIGQSKKNTETLSKENGIPVSDVSIGRDSDICLLNISLLYEGEALALTVTLTEIGGDDT